MSTTEENQSLNQASEESWKAPEFQLPMLMKTELLRLASVVGVESVSIDTEEEFTDFVDNAIRKIERLKYDRDEAFRSNSFKDSSGRSSKEETKLNYKVKTLEDDLRMSLKTVEDVATMKKRNSKLCEKLRNSNMHRSALESFIEAQNKKIQILVDHVEKLMKAVKIETSKSTKSIEANRQMMKDKNALLKKIEKFERIIATQNRYLTEIAEGSKVLEDQLKLMDEKFLELRSKLDVSRSHFAAQVNQAKDKMKELRLKYSIATKGGLLDSMNIQKYSQQLPTPTNQSSTNSKGTKRRPQTAMVSQSYDSGRPFIESPAMPSGSTKEGHKMANSFAGAMLQHGRDMWLNGETSSPMEAPRARSATINSVGNTTGPLLTLDKKGSIQKKSSKSKQIEAMKEQKETKVLRKIERKQPEFSNHWSDHQIQELLDA